MPTVIAADSRRHAFRDVDGVETVPKAEDAVMAYAVDWSDQLASGETISTATWTDDGVVCTGETISGGVTSAAVSGTNGATKVRITTSASRTLVTTINFIDTGDRL